MSFKEQFQCHANRNILHCLLLWNILLILYLAHSGPNAFVSVPSTPLSDQTTLDTITPTIDRTESGITTTSIHGVESPLHSVPTHHDNAYSNDERLRYYMGKWYDSEPNISEIIRFPPQDAV